MTITTSQKPKEVILRYKSLSSPSYFNLSAYYNEDYPSMLENANITLTVSNTSITLITNNSTAFAKSSGEYIWR